MHKCRTPVQRKLDWWKERTGPLCRSKGQPCPRQAESQQEYWWANSGQKAPGLGGQRGEQGQRGVVKEKMFSP